MIGATRETVILGHALAVMVGAVTLAGIFGGLAVTTGSAGHGRGSAAFGMIAGALMVAAYWFARTLH